MGRPGSISVSKMSDTPDPAILARLLATQSVLQSAASTEEQLALVTRVLEDIPGVARATYSLDGGAREGDGFASIPLQTPNGHYGRLLLTVDESTAWAPYVAPVTDFSGWLALLLEKQRAFFAGLQEALLDVPERLSGVLFGHVYRSASDEDGMGGDFYDVFETRDGGVGVVIGDVCGHGLEAVRLATLVKHSVCAFAHQFPMPHHVLRETNRLLLEKNVAGFVTTFLGFLDPTTGVMIYSSAGHPPPILSEDGGVALLNSRSTPLGIFFDARFSDGTIVMRPGATMVLYTDGVTEARRDETLFGERALMEAVGALVASLPGDLPGLLLERAAAFADGHLRDDAAVLALRYSGPTPAGR
jgi:hypothetical protein